MVLKEEWLGWWRVVKVVRWLGVVMVVGWS